jgi:FtsH-binding integral membrane protein
MFESLTAKTFAILGSQFFITWMATVGVLRGIRHFYRSKAVEITATANPDGKRTLELDWTVTGPYLSLLFIVAIGVYLLLWVIGTQNLALGIPLFIVWSILTGIALALVLISVNENLGSTVFAATATITYVAAVIGTFSTMDLTFWRAVFFGALLLLLVGNLIRLFMSIPRVQQRATAFFGVAVIAGYLLVDFNRLAKLEQRETVSSWNVAMKLAIDIYLDIIRLFLELLDLLSD